MGLSLSTATRTARAQAIITQAGASAKLKFYSGARPANVGTAASGTLLATVNFGSVIGTAASGAIDWDEAGASQTAASHVSGTPGYARLTTSADVGVMDIDLNGSAPTWTFTGTIATGQNVTLTSLSLTDGNV